MITNIVPIFKKQKQKGTIRGAKKLQANNSDLNPLEITTADYEEIAL